MMKELSANNLFEIGSYLSNNIMIQDNKLKNIILTFDVDCDYFKKIDEDIFYRLHKDESEYIPSENEINIMFSDYITLKIKKSEE